MTPKEYLMQYRQSMERTAEIEQHLNELKAEAYALKTHEGKSVALDAAVAKYVDACNASARELTQLEALRTSIKDAINFVPDKRYKHLLWEIYINGKKIVRIAADEERSYEHICRLHGCALQELGKCIVFPERSPL